MCADRELVVVVAAVVVAAAVVVVVVVVEQTPIHRGTHLEMAPDTKGSKNLRGGAQSGGGWTQRTWSASPEHC